MRPIRISLVVVSLGLALAGAPIDAQNGGGQWPQWRGPGGLGISTDADVALEWFTPAADGRPETNIKWKTEIPGRGHSSPVVWGDRIFLTTSIKGEHVPGRKAPEHLDFKYQPGYVHPDSVDVDYKHALKVLAIDAKTGKIIWERTAYDGLMADDRHRQNTYASPTMVTDGRFVYAFFESAGVYCYDVDGNLKWKTSLGGIIKAGLGPGTSPVLYENLLILQCDQEMGTGSAVVALDRLTGKEVWRAERSTRRSWATPLLVSAGGRTDLVASGAEVVIAYDPATGKEVWRANGTQSHPIPSPVAGQGVVVLSAGSGAKRAFAVKLGASGDLTDSEQVAWKHNKGTAYVSSPILVGKYVYLLTDAGVMTCLDAATGELIYEGGRPPVPATFRSSMVAVNDHLLLTSEAGETFVVRAGPKHEIVRTNSVGEPVWASPAVANGTIYIRGAQHLFAIAKGAK
jgi:outer membrane protein assembly factor BamB